jgi:CheY-like chemotaxis protein
VEREVDILLIEDNQGDVMLTREEFRSARVANNLHVCGDGESGLGFLRREGDYADAPRPDLVLLDLNLPKMSGQDVLETIKPDGLAGLAEIVEATEAFWFRVATLPSG